jgi:hypothetical protein
MCSRFTKRLNVEGIEPIFFLRIEELMLIHKSVVDSYTYTMKCIQIYTFGTQVSVKLTFVE